MANWALWTSPKLNKTEIIYIISNYVHLVIEDDIFIYILYLWSHFFKCKLNVCIL